ncbi:SURF1 family protein [Pararhizobium sp. IMCC21322]|uniref:SURF1 family protein n=1 Tax=Pararhizobium sp. IMCC21322 TaxID=3067903 RepID=UPI0027423E71|nr:SURF1 family protein [Pararhizobium sp. IMCC21322]
MSSEATVLAPLWRSLLWPGIVSAIALIVLLSLGTWQVQRMHWKEDLISSVTARLASEPAVLPPPAEWSALDPDSYQYRRIAVTGRYLHAHEQRAYMVVSSPKGGPLGGQGHWVMTPLELADGAVVWINRGFVPLHLADQDITTGQTEIVTLKGLMRPPEKAGFATPGNESGFDGKLWFVRDPAAMTLQTSLESGAVVAPFFVDLEAGNGPALPQAGETTIAFSNRHLGYVLTWYGIALTLIGVFVAFAAREYRKGQTPN